MRKYIIMLFTLSLSMFYCLQVLADAMDADKIKYIHATAKTSFFTLCKDKIVGATDDICNCLADSTVSNINDNTLMTCDTNNYNCISMVVKDAGLKAFSQDSIKNCVQKNEKKN